jgi:hypothetical protein
MSFPFVLPATHHLLWFYFRTVNTKVVLLRKLELQRYLAQVSSELEFYGEAQVTGEIDEMGRA